MHATPQEVTVTVSETPSATGAPELDEQAAAAPVAAEPAVDEAPVEQPTDQARSTPPDLDDGTG